MTNIRLPKDAASLASIWQYYDTRARQMLHEGFSWDASVEWAPGYEGRAARTFFQSEAGVPWASFFVVPEHRGQGLMRYLATTSRNPVVTVDDCNLEPVLKHLKVRHRVVGAQLLESAEYKLVQDFYGDQRAKRSQVFLMNHIDEGLAVMRWVGCTALAARAFCLHPLLQNDVDLLANHDRVATALQQVPGGSMTMALAMEYRSVANEYLAHRSMPPGGIRLSPLSDVNAMLIGDKVQNRKDFELYHAETHDNRGRLAEYFVQWCAALGVGAPLYEKLKARLPCKRVPPPVAG